jgi:hypothetical protein
MLIALFRLTMLVTYPASFQLFINLNGMLTLRHLSDTIHEPLSRAGARALRVGMVIIVQHAYCGVKMPVRCHLQSLHADDKRGDEHV